MEFLIIVLLVIAYLVIGWLLALVAAAVSPVWRKAMEDDDPPVLIIIVLWPLAAVFAPVYLFSEFLNPIDFVKKMEERRKARENVIVKSRKFRGKED